MSDTLLQKYTSRLADAPDVNSQFESDAADNLGCFGWLRGVRDRAVMLELRKKTGAVMAIGYAWLERAEYEPSEGITLYAAGRTICIKGRNLGGPGPSATNLFSGLTRHRVPWVAESEHGAEFAGGEKLAVVEAIGW